MAQAQVLSSKRGLGDSGASYSNLQATGASWYYTWGTGLANPGTFDANNYPMFWNAPSTSTINTATARNPNYILGFNEPERSDQANMSVATAISSWTTISSSVNSYNSANGTSIKLVSPAVADTGGTTGGQAWLSSFMSQATSAGLKVDAVAFHWYGVSTPTDPAGAASSFLSRVDSYHNSYGKPVFITEFAIHDWGGVYTDAQIIEANRQFLNIVVPGLESRSYVAGYAWYNWFSDSHLYDATTLEPTVMGYDYIGAIQNGSTTNIGGVNLGEHIAYLNGGTLTATSAVGSVKYLEALYDPNVTTNTSTISGTVDWGLTATTNWAKVQANATLKKSGTNTISFTAGSLTNNGTIEVQQGVLRLGISPTGSGAFNISSDGGATGSTARLELTGGVTIPHAFTFAQRNDPAGSDGIRNVSGNNVLSGPMTIVTGGSQARIQSDAGMLTLSGGISTNATSNRSLYFQGAADGLVSSAITNNSANSAGTISVFKSGAGTWTLSGANNFSGSATVSAGKLFLKNSGTMTSLTLASGATMQTSGALNVSGAISLSGVSDLSDNALNNLSGAGTLAMASTTTTLEIGNSNSDRISATGAATITGTNTINLKQVLGQSVTPGTSYTLISAASGLSAANFSLGANAASLNFTTLNLSTPTPTALIVTATGNPTPTTAYWTGAASSTLADGSNNWGVGKTINATNWSTNSAGTADPAQLPGAVTNVIFTAATAGNVSGTSATQLDSNYAVQSLTFDVGLATGISTTVLNTNGYALGVGNGGLTLAATSNSAAVVSGSGSVAVSTNQSWANNSNALSLTVSAPVSAVSGATLLTLNGAGTGGVTLSGVISDGGGVLSTVFNQAGVTSLSAVNTYTGTTTVAGGVVEITSTGSIASNPTINSGGTLRLVGGTDGISNAAVVNVLAGGTLDLRGTAAGVAKTETLGGLTGGGVITRGISGLSTLTAGSGNISSTFSGSIQNGSGQLALVKTGTGVLTLSGTSNFTGGLTINDGAGAVQVTSNGGLGNGSVTIGNGNTNQSGVLKLSGNIAISSVPTINFAGRDLSSTDGTADIENVSGNNNLSANFNINNVGGSAVNILSDAGTLILTGAMSSTGLTSSRGYDFYGIGDGIATGVISNGTAQPTFVQMDGPGTWTLSGANTYTGGTTVNGGTLVLSGASSYSGGTIINSGTVVMANTLGLGSASSTVTPSNGGTLIVRTGGGDRAYNLNMGSNTGSANLVSGVATGSVGINHTLGTFSIGINDTINVLADSTITSGSPSITLGAITLSSGVGAGSSTFNPTTANVTLASVTTSTNSAKTVILDGTSGNNFITGAITNGSNVITLVKSNTSTWTLSGSNSFTGGVTLYDNGGNLKVTSSSGLGSGAVTIGQGNTNPTGTLQLSGNIAITAVPTFNFATRALSTAGGAPDIENLSGNNTITSSFNINNTGGNGVNIRSTSGTLTLNGGMTSTGLTSARGFDFYAAAAGSGITNGVISDGTAVPTFVQKDGAGVWTLNGTNTYTGGAILNDGTLNVSTDSNLGNASGSLTINGGTLKTTASFSTARTVTVNSAGGAIDTGAFATTLSGTLSVSGPLTKLGAGSLIIAGAQSHAAGAVLNANAGVTTFQTDAGPSSRTLIVNANASVNFAATQHLAALNVGPGATTTLTSGGGKLLVTNTLSLGATSALDLTDNDAVILATAATRASELANATSEIASAFHAGQWNSPGITSSTAAANLIQLSAVGILLNDNGSGLPRFGTFDGQAVDANSILLKYTYYGDANLDGVVNGADYALIDNGYNLGLSGWGNGDFNYDGVINAADYALMDNAYNFQSGILSAGTSLGGLTPLAPVPEPHTAVLLALGAAPWLVCIARRRLRHGA
jgi:autotransporter-associated beta strand protein